MHDFAFYEYDECQEENVDYQSVDPNTPSNCKVTNGDTNCQENLQNYIEHQASGSHSSFSYLETQIS